MYYSVSDLEVGAGLLGAEVALVGAVAAVVLSVALPRVGDAAPVAAPELARLACHVQAAILIYEKNN
jgi:hypothetical protein